MEVDALNVTPGLAQVGGVSRRDVATAEQRARQDLRAQIAGLEKRLGELFAAAFPRRGFDWGVDAVGGPRILSVGELERVRDSLAARVREAQVELGRRTEIEEANRGLVEEMIVQPDRYRWVRVSNEDVGDRGCRHWHSRPRWGILGMLMGWWRVKLSSGCPLAGGRAALEPAPARPRRPAAHMSKRRRKRRPRAAPAERRPAEPRSAPRRSSADPDERPPAPWGRFPLVELVILCGLAALIGGFVVGGARGRTLLLVGLTLGALGGLELSIREHFAGYRSHTTLLAGAASIAVLAVLAVGVPSLWLPIALAIAAVVFVALAVVLTRAFQRRSGRTFKVR